MIRFILSLLVTAAALQLVAMYSGWMAGPAVFSMVVNVFMVGLTVLMFRMVSTIGDRQKFTQVYLATIVIKILAVCSFAAIVIVLDRDQARSNVVFLIVLYAIYTAIEVGFLVVGARLNKA